MAIDFAAHAPSQEDKEKNALELVGEQVKQLDDLLEEQTAKLEELAELEEKIKAINEKYLPDLFEEYGLADIRLKDGRKLVLNNKWRPSITQENMAEAYEWLKDHGHGDLIKNAINIKFKKEESKKALELLKYLLNEGYPARRKEEVHWQTLQAFINEQIEKGEEIPQAIFGLYQQRQVVIKKK